MTLRVTLLHSRVTLRVTLRDVISRYLVESGDATDAGDATFPYIFCELDEKAEGGITESSDAILGRDFVVTVVTSSPGP